MFLLMNSIGCSGTPQQIIKTEYIKQQIPEIPKEPEYYKVIWEGCGNKHCVDDANARNLKKNYELMKMYQMDLRNILEGLK